MSILQPYTSHLDENHTFNGITRPNSYYFNKSSCSSPFLLVSLTAMLSHNGNNTFCIQIKSWLSTSIVNEDDVNIVRIRFSMTFRVIEIPCWHLHHNVVCRGSHERIFSLAIHFQVILMVSHKLCKPQPCYP